MTPEIAADTRNVVDEFKGMAVDAIRLAMQARRTPMVTIATNVTHDFNKGSILRAHEAHGGREFILLNKDNEQLPGSETGVKHWDRRGAVGMHHYSNITHVNISRWREILDGYRAEGYTIYAVDNMPDHEPVPIYDVTMPEKTAFVYGEEGPGLPVEIIEACDQMIYIPQFGVPRSLNVAQAAAICMYEYARQNRPVL